MKTETAAERLLDDLTVQTQGEAQAWINRLDAMRGQHTVDEARRHVEAMGSDRLLEELDKISYPLLQDVLERLDPSQRWTKSEAKVRVETRYDRHNRGRALHCLSSLEMLQRAKSMAQFWQLVGIHPRDAEDDPDGFSLELAWRYFTEWKAYAVLAMRSAGHEESARFAIMAKAYQILTAEFLRCAPRKEDFERAAELAAEGLESMRRGETK